MLIRLRAWWALARLPRCGACRVLLTGPPIVARGIKCCSEDCAVQYWWYSQA